jgi:arsenate reductase (thioredoxin)
MKASYNVLFVCTGNSARSILAEAVANHMGGGRLKAYSAGSHPRGHVHPDALELLRGIGLPVEGLRSKSWHEFAAADAPTMDLIITVCDRAAGEPCPIWPGHPETARWSVPDPSRATGSHDERRAAFKEALHVLQNRITLLLSLPSLEPLTIQTRLDQDAFTGRPSSP